MAKRDYVVVQEGAEKRSAVSGEWRKCVPWVRLTDNYDAIRIPVKETDQRGWPFYPYCMVHLES